MNELKDLVLKAANNIPGFSTVDIVGISIEMDFDENGVGVKLEGSTNSEIAQVIGEDAYEEFTMKWTPQLEDMARDLQDMLNEVDGSEFVRLLLARLAHLNNQMEEETQGESVA